MGTVPTPEQAAIFRALAARYVWWKDPNRALEFPTQIAAQVMNIGDWEDVQALVKATGDDYLRLVLGCAEAGQFNERSWTYWHYRLRLSELGAVPPLPERRLE